MAKPMVGFDEALEVVTEYSQTLRHGPEVVTLAGGGGHPWQVSVTGGASPALNRLVTSWRLTESPNGSYVLDQFTVRLFTGRVGRVYVTLHVREHIVRHIDGRTGKPFVVASPELF